MTYPFLPRIPAIRNAFDTPHIGGVVANADPACRGDNMPKRVTKEPMLGREDLCFAI